MRRTLGPVLMSHQTLEYKDSTLLRDLEQSHTFAHIETQSKTVVHIEFLRIPPYDSTRGGSGCQSCSRTHNPNSHLSALANRNARTDQIV